MKLPPGAQPLHSRKFAIFNKNKPFSGPVASNFCRWRIGPAWDNLSILAVDVGAPIRGESVRGWEGRWHVMSRLRRATKRHRCEHYTAGAPIRSLVIVSIVLASAAFVRADEAMEPLSEPATESGLVLPLPNSTPLSASQDNLLSQRSTFSTIDDSTTGAQGQPIPVPLPPGVWSGVIGLVAVVIARSRWKMRRA
jgi:hypothetical protein